jgi:hypothetical protein
MTLAGVEVYENLSPMENIEHTITGLTELLAQFRGLARRLDEHDAFASHHETILTGGGSMWFDLVVAGLDDPKPCGAPSARSYVQAAT